MSNKTAVSYEGTFSGTNPGGVPFTHRVSGTIFLDNPTSLEEIKAQLTENALIIRRGEAGMEPETLSFDGVVGGTRRTIAEWTVAKPEEK